MRGVIAAVLVAAILISGTVAGAAYWMNRESARRDRAVMQAIETSDDAIVAELRGQDSTPLSSSKFSSTPSPYLGAHERSLLALEAIAAAMTDPVPSYQDW